MSEFSRTFLRERIGDESRPREFLGVFGKHPGWDDHIEDLPLPTASMAAAKQLLYVEGIGSQISSGAWVRLQEAARLPGFDHVFLWVRGEQFLVGRMWASSDGKRRAHFPMVALVHGIKLPCDAALAPILWQLESFAEGCRATRSAAQVRELLTAVRGDHSVPPDESEVARSTLGLSRNRARQIAEDFRHGFPAKIRLPADAQDVIRSVRFWSSACTALVSAETPLLFLAPLGEPWVDLLAGEPTPEQFFCLRAGPSTLPIAHEAGAEEELEEVDAEQFAKAASCQKDANEGGSWISRFLRH